MVKLKIRIKRLKFKMSKKICSDFCGQLYVDLNNPIEETICIVGIWKLKYDLKMIMFYQIWDEEIAEKAAKWAERNKLEDNPELGLRKQNGVKE